MTGAVCYAVTWGEYSDCEVVRVFATREEAEAWRETKAEACHVCGGQGVLPDQYSCHYCYGTGRLNRHYVEDVPFGPEESP